MGTGSFKNVTYNLLVYKVYMYKQDLALNNLYGSKCRKIQPSFFFYTNFDKNWRDSSNKLHDAKVDFWIKKIKNLVIIYSYIYLFLVIVFAKDWNQTSRFPAFFPHF